MPIVISFKGEYKLTSTITGTVTNREINFQLMTNSKGLGTDIPFNSLGDTIKQLGADISTCHTTTNRISGNLFVETDKIDDKNSSKSSEGFTIESRADLEKLLDFMMNKLVGLTAPAPQPQVMDDLKQPFLPSRQPSNAKRDEDSNSDECCATIKSALRCVVS